VVDGPDNHRALRVAALVAHQHLLPDARQEHRPESRPRHRLQHPHPARPGQLSLSTVPVEGQLHPSVLVGVDLLPLRAHHRRSLETVHLRPGGPAQGPVGPAGGDPEEARLVVRLHRPRAFLAPPLVRHTHRQELLVPATLRMPPHLEDAARGEREHSPSPRPRLRPEAQLLQSHPRQPPTVARVRVTARVLVHLLALPIFSRHREVERRPFEVVVAQHHLPRHAPRPPRQLVQVLLVRRRAVLLPVPDAPRLGKAPPPVPHHHRAAAFAVFEPVPDPLLLQHPRQERQVRLSILRGALPLRIAPSHFPALRDLPRVEHLLRDLGHGRVGKGPAPARDPQHAEPRR
jgi:hypothetical protein